MIVIMLNGNSLNVTWIWIEKKNYKLYKIKSLVAKNSVNVIFIYGSIFMARKAWSTTKKYKIIDDILSMEKNCSVK